MGKLRFYLRSYFVAYKEIILYLFFGGLAFLVSIGTYGFFNQIMGMHELVANVISWIITVLFAFFTNRLWVFDAPVDSLIDFFKQMAFFFSGRLVTLLIEEVILFGFISCLSFPSMSVKIIAQVVVIVLNYVISKVVVFRKKTVLEE